ncbi:hypothetical protein GCM10011499_08170 [Pelagibacterium lentulum]|uniref:Phytanoyl-CoA dioxygenase (PhyH) n=2 Tax=Pelagibacterium lentulum TaxID=2029865 RepID=A0A916RAL2_9HYPH|nr:hypothetical protein GCM10011499_08170 [Pelagibacterium lentulum]
MKLRFPRFDRNESVSAATPAPMTEPETSQPPTESEAPILGPDELALLNAAALDYLRGLSLEDIQRRVDAVSVDEIETEAGIETASKLLEDEGIVIVRDFLDQTQLKSADGAIARVVNALEASSPERNYEDDDILVQSAERVATSYTAMASHQKTVATIRRGADAGMVDVFNVDRLAGDERNALRAPFVSEGLLRLIIEGDNPPEAKNLNLYVNRGITHTRGFHADSFGKSLKGFVYLSDVVSLDDGPYCFVRRTHVDGPWRRANQKISELAQAKTESPFIDVGMAIPVLAPRGSLILSDQAGVHRGIPQAAGAERRVLVMRYL